VSFKKCIDNDLITLYIANYLWNKIGYPIWFTNFSCQIYRL